MARVEHVWWGVIIFLLCCFCVTTSTAISELEFLPEVELTYEHFSNWAGTINRSEPFLTAHPKSEEDVVEVTNWAWKAGRNLRVVGGRHSFSPLTLTEADPPEKVILVDLRDMRELQLGTLRWRRKTLTTIQAQTGATMDEFFSFAETHGLGINSSPDAGDVSIGGVLAVGGHGTGISSRREPAAQPGLTLGSLSNMILGFKAVVWDAKKECYSVKSFSRGDADSGAFLVHIGRAVLIQVTLLTGENYRMSMISRTDIPRSELVALGNSTGRTFSSLLEEYGRVDLIQHTFTEGTWLKIGVMENIKRPESREVRHPYNYPFYGAPNPSGTTVLGPEMYSDVVKGLRWTNSSDLWGLSKNTLLHVRIPPSPLIFSGFGVVGRRDSVQDKVHQLSEEFIRLTEEYRRAGEYPIEGGIQFRVTGIDDPKETLVEGATVPLLSHSKGVSSRPDWNAVLWVNTFTSRGNPKTPDFMRRFEEFAHGRWNGADGIVRPEWAKLWGFSDEKAFGAVEDCRPSLLPTLYGVEEWNQVVATLDRYDPHKVFTNEFLRKIFVKYEWDKGGATWGWGKSRDIIT